MCVGEKTAGRLWERCMYGREEGEAISLSAPTSEGAKHVYGPDTVSQ